MQIVGQPGHQIGRVSMDMLTVDLADLPLAGVGGIVMRVARVLSGA